MNVYLDVKGDAALGNDALDRIFSLGFDGIRRTLPESREGSKLLLSEIANFGFLRPIVVVAGGDMTRKSGPAWFPTDIINKVEETCHLFNQLGLADESPGPMIQIGSAPDQACHFWAVAPELAAATLTRCQDDVLKILGAQAEVISPPISNLTMHGFAYLGNMVRDGIPNRSVVGFQRMAPVNEGPPESAHEGFGDRWAEIRLLKAIAGPRRVACMSTGFHDGLSSPKGLDRFLDRIPGVRRRTGLTEASVANRVRDELRLWLRADVELVVLSEYQDALWSEQKGGYGVFTWDGRPKALARALPEILAEIGVPE